MICNGLGVMPGTSATWHAAFTAFSTSPAEVPERGWDYATYTGDAEVDSLIWGTRWSADTVTYALPATRAEWGAAFPDARVLGFVPPGDGLLAAVELILAGRTEVAGAPATRFGSVASFTLLDFAPGTTAEATLRIGLVEDIPGALGFAIPPGLPVTNPVQVVGSGELRDGDVWLSTQGADRVGEWDLGALLPGTDQWLTLIHEIGHALGLSHPFSGAVLAGNAGAIMPDAANGNEFTVMAYNGIPGPGSDLPRPDPDSSPQGWMTYDIRALQQIYGANFGWQAGDTTYRWDPATGEMFIDGIGQGAPVGNRVLLAIWDGGGRDTYDVSNYADGVRVDLRPGEGSVLSFAQLAVLGRIQDDGGEDILVRAEASVRNAFLYGGDPRSLIEDAIGGDGDDRLRGNDAANRLQGGAGRDTLIGDAGADTLDGGSGADRLEGGRGNDVYILDDAGDVIAELPNEGRDLVIAPFGMTLADALDDLRLTAAAGIAAGTGNALSNRITGNDFANTLSGLDGDDLLLGGGGMDVLRGGAGRDQLDGGAEADRLEGEGGDDQLLGQDGADRLAGGDGNDQLAGHAGADTLDGGAGNDTLAGGTGADSMAGGAGNDLYLVEDAADRLREAAGAGADTVVASVDFRLGATFEVLFLTGAARSGTGNAADNLIAGTSGDDTLRGLAGDDDLGGGKGNDLLIGAEGNDSLFGAEGDDAVRGDTGDDILNGGDGNDTASGGDGADDLDGGQGADRLDGGADNDTLYGGAGQDTLLGGDGDDELSGNAEADRLSGGAGADTLRAGDGHDTVSGGDGDDEVQGGAGNDRLSAEGGRDTVDGQDGNDTISGGAEYDLLDGAAGDDVLDGGEGGDDILGGQGADRLSGGAGNDYLQGGGRAPGVPFDPAFPDNDTLTGGAGADIFTFIVDDRGADIVTDFDLGEDQLYFVGLFADAAAALAALSATGAGARFDLGAEEGSVLLRGIAAASLTADHILIA